MGAKGVASSAAGTAALLYVVLSGRLSSDGAERLPRWRHGGKDIEEGSDERWPERAPASWREAAAVVSRTLRFAYGETLGKWPLGDIAFGISHYMRLQGNLQHEYAGSSCVPLEGPGPRQELIALLRYLRLCMFFSKKPYEVFLEFGGYDQSDTLIRKSKAKLMKPKFTVVRDESTRCFLLFIRGAISFKDRLTAATAGEVPFQHVVSHEGRGSSVVVGHAHCGMVAAARWVADQAIPCLSRAIELFPDYKIKIIGHSMGAAIAAILTCILRENKKLSSSSCIAFGPAACMTWDLAESSKDFVTTVVNKNDLVPSFGKVSAASLRAEVVASSWAPDLQKQIQQKRMLSFVNHSLNFVRFYAPLAHNPSSKVADVECRMAEAEMKHSEDVRSLVKKHSALSCWPYVAAGRQTLEAADIEAEKGTDAEHTEQLVEDRRRSPSTASQAPPHRQLYPPGRIMHMVALPAASGEQGSKNAGVALYETPRGTYGKIRLERSMIKDHYMPRYVETMEVLIDRLAEEEDAPLRDTNEVRLD